MCSWAVIIYVIKITQSTLFTVSSLRIAKVLPPAGLQFKSKVVDALLTEIFAKPLLCREKKLVNKEESNSSNVLTRDYKGIVNSESGGKEPAGFALVPEKVQVEQRFATQSLQRFAVNNRPLILR